MNLQKQIDELSNGGEQLEQNLDQQDQKLKDLIQNWTTEYNKNDQKDHIDLNSEISKWTSKSKSNITEYISSSFKQSSTINIKSSDPTS